MVIFFPVHFSNDGWGDIEALDIKLPPVEMPTRPGEFLDRSTSRVFSLVFA